MSSGSTSKNDLTRKDLLNALLSVSYAVPDSNYLAPFYNLKQLVWENIEKKDIRNFDSGKEYTQVMLKRLEKNLLAGKELVKDFSRCDDELPAVAMEIFKKIAIKKDFISTKITIPISGNASVIYKGNRSGYAVYDNVSVSEKSVFEAANRFAAFGEEDFSVGIVTDKLKVAVSFEDSGMGMKNTYTYFAYYIDENICVKDRLAKYINLPSELSNDIAYDKSYSIIGQ